MHAMERPAHLTCKCQFCALLFTHISYILKMHWWHFKFSRSIYVTRYQFRPLISHGTVPVPLLSSNNLTIYISIDSFNFRAGLLRVLLTRGQIL